MKPIIPMIDIRNFDILSNLGKGPILNNFFGFVTVLVPMIILPSFLCVRDCLYISWISIFIGTIYMFLCGRLIHLMEMYINGNFTGYHKCNQLAKIFYS